LTADDYLEIPQLDARYNHAIDSGDAEGYANLFVPDGSFNNDIGHDALIAFIKNRNGANMRHWNTNLVITPTSEGANGPDVPDVSQRRPEPPGRHRRRQIRRHARQDGSRVAVQEADEPARGAASGRAGRPTATVT
jgi:hypothetical protein